MNNKRRMCALEIVLLALGSPIWFSLLVALFAVILAVYISIWAVIISLWSVFVAVLVSALCAIIAFAFFLISGHALTGIALFGAGLFCIGFTVFAFLGCKAVTKGILILTKLIVLKIKKSFTKRGAQGE